MAAVASGLSGEFVSFVDTCLDEYDTDGWTAPDLINPSDISAMPKRKNGDR